MREFHSKFDAVVLPTMPLVAFDAGKEQPGPETELGWVDFTPFVRFPISTTEF